MNSTLTPVQGCLIKLDVNGELRYGIVSQIKNEETGVIKWISTDIKNQFSDVKLKDLQPAFKIGMEVQDATPEIGYQRLGRGVIVFERKLAGFHQYLVNYEQDNIRVWMPFQHLIPVKNAEARFKGGDVSISQTEVERFRLRVLANAIKLWNENTGALSHLDIDPLPHQINLVHHILKTNNLNWLIADDVGLGKTIETGMLLHALRQRDQARRVLLVTPAGLTKQWKEEMYHKFHIDEFKIYGTDFFINEQREWKQYDYVIGSMDTLKHDNHIEKLLDAGNWDLVIFDEGHRLSRRQYGNKYDSSDRFDLAAKLRLKTKAMIILSATPHQGDQAKFVALLELLRPERRRDLLQLDRNPEIIRDMIYRNHKADVTDKDGKFIFKGKVTKAIAIPTTDEFQEFEELLSAYFNKGYQASQAEGNFARAIGFVMTTYRKLAASSVMAIHKALLKRVTRLEMSYQSVHENLHDLNDERYAGEILEEELTKILNDGKNAIEFFAGELDDLKELIEVSRDLIREDKKIKVFIESIIDRILTGNALEKVLIFTEYRTTQEYIKAKLEERYGLGKVEIINGSMKHDDRMNSIKNFEESGQFLISTEAGGEGINLQKTCNIMVNYDLPWNPMRLVQRIGRLYRYGQQKNVLIFNLHQPDSVDVNIIFKMYERIEQIVNDLSNVQKHEFNDGLKDEILGELSQYVDIEDVLKTLTNIGVSRTEERIEEALKNARDAVNIQREILSYASSGDAEGVRTDIQVETKHIESFILGMLDILDIEHTIHSESRYIRIRFNEENQKRFKSILGKASLLEVTIDRSVAVNRPNIHMLDLSSPIMQFFIEKAMDYDTGGLCCAISDAENSHINFMTANILKWQDLQGNVVRKQFCIYTYSPKSEHVNPPKILDTFTKKLVTFNQPISISSKQANTLLEKADSVLQNFMSEKSNPYLMPNDLYCSSVALNIVKK
ncbi:SNF2-related protein [Acinetobacter baumannii]|uniref:DEAD/DEAH box helicase n=1 Tax=Acinetobacter calcoaceticus/baumannii complex TaxID=909768 RepID=UPI00244D3C4D|nr:SNF2-related protein [Acinetobacter baumannii]MDH2667488.1 SNF2-related protein [Acinetobacter baumannii]